MAGLATEIMRMGAHEFMQRSKLSSLRGKSASAKVWRGARAHHKRDWRKGNRAAPAAVLGASRTRTMNSIWLEDFLTLAEAKGFARAAEQRFISQPSFSRRIQALEEWLGVVLVDRGTHSFRLTAAGDAFRPRAIEALNLINQAKLDAQEAGTVSEQKLRFAATHVLSLTFFPQWLRTLEAPEPLAATIELTADHMAACETLLLEGRVQFLICHHHPHAPVGMRETFHSEVIGRDQLLPVAATDVAEKHTDDALPLLSFSPQSGLGRILAAVLDARPARKRPVIFSSHLSNVLTAMVRNGRGMAWCPLSQIQDDLANGTLQQVCGAGDPIDIEIRIWRPRSRLSPSAEELWGRVKAELRRQTACPEEGLELPRP